MFLVLTMVIGAAAGGTFGFHPYFPKMAGDLVSNMYEEIVYRGLMFCAFYGVASASRFPLAGKLNRAGLVAGTIGSCAVFAAGHDQYSMALRVVVGWSPSYLPIRGSRRDRSGPLGSRIHWAT
jgi:hypothetical protein